MQETDNYCFRWALVCSQVMDFVLPYLTLVVCQSCFEHGSLLRPERIGDAGDFCDNGFRYFPRCKISERVFEEWFQVTSVWNLVAEPYALIDRVAAGEGSLRLFCHDSISVFVWLSESAL